MGNTNFFLFFFLRLFFLFFFFLGTRSQAIIPVCQMERLFLPKSRINFGKTEMFYFGVSDRCKTLWRFPAGGVFSWIFPWWSWVEFSIQFHRKKKSTLKKSKTGPRSSIWLRLETHSPGEVLEKKLSPGEQKGPRAPRGPLSLREAVVATCCFPSIPFVCVSGHATLKFFEASGFLQWALPGSSPFLWAVSGMGGVNWHSFISLSETFLVILWRSIYASTKWLH